MAIMPFGSAVHSSIAAQFARESYAIRRVLLIDPTHDIPAALRSLIGANVVTCTGESVSRKFLEQVAPDVVMVPLIGSGHDVFDLTNRLINYGYSGRIRAFSRPVPNAQLICKEVENRFPRLDFRLIEVPCPNRKSDLSR
ncbi:hypothetical protein [Albirhodobacter sp. R86504]|jgi:hypothetical protein|uniref:hypothetical protein n=1 Tax=Albirhodobacter sp. R86504 TaxID=3093848 RepID=UPI003670EEED